MMDGSGRVNWEHLKAVHHVVSIHVVEDDEPESLERFPMSLAFTQIVAAPVEGEVAVEGDWAGVTGTWHCAFCFCDHRVLGGKCTTQCIPCTHSLYSI
jgi:hypothetical protein